MFLCFLICSELILPLCRLRRDPVGQVHMAGNGENRALPCSGESSDFLQSVAFSPDLVLNRLFVGPPQVEEDFREVARLCVVPACGHDSDRPRVVDHDLRLRGHSAGVVRHLARAAQRRDHAAHCQRPGPLCVSASGAVAQRGDDIWQRICAL